MSQQPIVLVTATTELIRGRPRVRLNDAYVQAIAAAGLVPLVLPPVAPALALDALDHVAGLVLTGGEDLDPAAYGEAPHAAAGEPQHDRDACELALARAAHERRMPTLAICRGAQVINVALGGALVQDIPSQCETTLVHTDERRAERVHDAAIAADSMLARVVGATDIRVNSSHHQSARRAAPGLRVTGRAPDGVVEALEPTDADWWMLAVQWHPEELTQTPEPWDRRLFAAFARAADGAD